jgi:thiol-disulfide isomerase/thioredoxin
MRKILLINCSLLLIFLIGCKPKEEPLSYDSFNHIEHWDDIKKIEMGLVIIYYYSPYCLVCQAIEEDVFKYAHAASKNYTIYFIHSGMILDQGEPNFEIPSTPALIILQDGELKQYERGPIAVVEYLKNLAND